MTSAKHYPAPLLYVCRSHPAFNKEVFVDFVAAQIKTLSFLAYIVRIFQVYTTTSLLENTV